MKKHVIYSMIAAGCLFLLLSLESFSQSTPVRQVKLNRFDLQSSAVIREKGDSLSSVPSTVLTGLVANKVYPDLYTGMNNMLIPDASDSFNREFHLEQYSHMPNEPNPDPGLPAHPQLEAMEDFYDDGGPMPPGTCNSPMFPDNWPFSSTPRWSQRGRKYCPAIGRTIISPSLRDKQQRLQ